jgi:hypothetical protein
VNNCELKGDTAVVTDGLVPRILVAVDTKENGAVVGCVVKLLTTGTAFGVVVIGTPKIFVVIAGAVLIADVAVVGGENIFTPAAG